MPQNGRRKGGWIAFLNQQAGLAIGDDLRDASMAGCHHRHTGTKRLKHHRWQPLAITIGRLLAGNDHRAATGKTRCKLVRRLPAEKGNARQITRLCAHVMMQRATAGDLETDGWIAGSDKPHRRQ